MDAATIAKEMVEQETAEREELVTVNESDVLFLFNYKFAKNWYGVKSKAWIDSQFQTWLNGHIAATFKQQRKQIETQLKNKLILEAAKGK